MAKQHPNNQLNLTILIKYLTQALPNFRIKKIRFQQHGNAACLQHDSRLTTIKATRLSVLMAFESSIVRLSEPDRATVTQFLDEAR